MNAGQPDLATQQHRQLTADGETQAGATVFARCAGISLLEGLEDQPLLFWRDTDAGVLDRKRHDVLGLAEYRVVCGPPSGRQPHANFHLTLRSELDGV